MLGLEKYKQGVSEEPRVVPIVEPPFKLVQVGVKVLDGDVVVGADDRPLQEAPNVLDGVGVGVSPYPLFEGVIDCLVSGVLVGYAVVGGPIVGEVGDSFIGGDFTDELVKGVAVTGLYDLEDYLVSALYGAHDNGFVVLVAPTFASYLASNKSFVDLHEAAQGERVGFIGCGSDPVAKIPGRAVCHVESPLELKSGHALFRFSHKVDGEKPFFEREVRVVEHRSGCNAELVAAVGAVVLVAAWGVADVHCPTPDTGHAVRPAKLLQYVSALLFAVIFVHELYQIHAFEIHHLEVSHA